MILRPASSPASVVVDASFLIALSAKEPGREARAHAHLAAYGAGGSQLYAPGVLVAECLYVLCKKLEAGLLTASQHHQAVLSLETYAGTIASPPGGEGPLVLRAEQLRGSYSCRRSADSLYLALAEALAASGTVELVTFDAGIQNQAAAARLVIAVRVLAP